MVSDLDDSDSSDDSLHHTKIIKSAFDSETFDADGTIHVDGLVGSATISPSGRDIALASPDGLAIIDLDSPYNAPRRVKSHGMPWLVVDVQWSPFAARDYWVASTANHCCLVWNLNRPDDSSAGAVEHSLRGHRRSITDINFSAHHPDMLATCSVDGYVHCWDLRRPNTPALAFIDWVAGATQVKYNRQNDHVIASSHNRCVHIWDDRKASAPLRTIEAHTSKIYGLDWNRTNSTSLVTCSLDKTIRFWDYTAYGGSRDNIWSSTASLSVNDNSIRGAAALESINDNDVPERVIRTHFPVWRARHTPFGGGILAMPQNAPGNLYLYDARPASVLATEDPHALNEAVAVFPGHGHHKAKEFLWRARGGIDNGLDNREFQLVSWGEDNKLRLSRLDNSDLATVGHQRGCPAPKNLSTSRAGASYKTFRILEDLGDYERRSATMSSLTPASQRMVPLSASKSIDRRGPLSPSEEAQRHQQDHNHSHRHSKRHHQHGSHMHRHQQSRQSNHQLPHEGSPSTGFSPSLSSPRSISSTNNVRDSIKPAPLTPQRTKLERRTLWRNPSMRAVQGSGRKKSDQSSMQLVWMKGVTMSKRKTSTEPSLGSNHQHSRESHSSNSHRMFSSESSLSSPLRMSWYDTSASMSSEGSDEPESIQEEILRITDKLPRVKWEELNMDNLALVASMTGPWGTNGQNVFIKLHVLVPPSYPTSRTPRFYIENSLLVPQQTQERLAADLVTLATECLKRRRNCLLIVFRYLLGELDLQTSLARLNPGLFDSRLANDENTESSSSSDDEDALANTVFFSSDGAIGSAAMADTRLSRQRPMPRTCGAVFTRDGRIVTFSLTKAGKASAKIMLKASAPPTGEELAKLERPKFIGFGKVLPERTARRRGSSSTDNSDSDSDSSNSSFSSSSSSTASSPNPYRPSPMGLMDPWTTNVSFHRHVVRGDKLSRKRRLSYDEDDDATSMTRSGMLDPDQAGEPESIVVIEDMCSFLPSKRELAREYAIFGDGADVCEHNARVAEKYEMMDLVSIWRYAALLLKSDVPLQRTCVFDVNGRRKSVLVIAQEALAKADGNADSNDEQFKPVQQRRWHDNLTGRVKWGLHPLARDFVNDLFDHFEKLADTQMLAMLSCIFGESFEEDSDAYVESHLSRVDTPLPLKAPSFSLDYMPRVCGLLNRPLPPQLVVSGASTPGLSTVSNDSGSYTSMPGAIFYDGSIDPDYDDDFDDYEDDETLRDVGAHDENDKNDKSGKNYSNINISFFQGNTYSNDSNSSGVLSSTQASGVTTGRFMRQSNNAVMSAIAAGVPQTLNALLSTSPNGISGSGDGREGSGGGSSGGESSGSKAVTISAQTTSRRPSLFGPARPLRQSPQNRFAYLGDNLNPPSAQRWQQNQDQKQALRAIDRRDFSAMSSDFRRVLGASTLTAHRNAAGLGRLAPLSTARQEQVAARKRPSPAETIFSNLTGGNLAWAASALFGIGGGSGKRGSGSAGPSTQPGTAATPVSDEGNRRKQSLAKAAVAALPRDAKLQLETAAPGIVAVDIVVRTYNDDLFDDDGWIMSSLLGAKRTRRLLADYRYAYAELLQVWNEPLARLEVLKFNVLREDAIKATGTSSGDASSSITSDNTTTTANANGTAGGSSPQPSHHSNGVSTIPGTQSKHDHLTAIFASGRGLDAVGICQQCELQLDPLEYDARGVFGISAAVQSKYGGSGGRCRRCRRVFYQQRCVYCTEPIDAIVLPCFGCGCASHPRCLRAWQDAGERFCPAGDECVCAEEAMTGRIESWTAMQAQLALGGSGHAGARDKMEAEAGTQPQQAIKSRDLLAQARRPARYAAASSSSAALVSPYGQISRPDDSKGGGDIKATLPTLRKGNSNSVPMIRSASKTSSSDHYDGPSDRSMLSSNANYSGAGLGIRGRAVGNNAITTPAIATTTNTGGGGFWGSNRRSRQDSPGVRQQLHQYQIDSKQQQVVYGIGDSGAVIAASAATGAQRQTRVYNAYTPELHQQQNASPASFSQGDDAGSTSGSAAANAVPPGNGGHQSAARQSLSSRLLRGSTLRRQTTATSVKSSEAAGANGSDDEG
ncbi:MAG: hypothetical protein SEPTF4163_004682 [Sporothrix epigloea]